jgi:hypothetical protein
MVDNTKLSRPSAKTDLTGIVVGNAEGLLFCLECKASKNEASFPPHNLKLSTPRVTTI